MEREPQPALAWLRDSAASQMPMFALGPGPLLEPGAVTMAGRSRCPGMEATVTTLRSSHIDRSENICPASLTVLVSAAWAADCSYACRRERAERGGAGRADRRGYGGLLRRGRAADRAGRHDRGQPGRAVRDDGPRTDGDRAWQSTRPTPASSQSASAASTGRPFPFLTCRCQIRLPLGPSGSPPIAAGHGKGAARMSEYQYYEFLALDRPLTENTARCSCGRLSTRAEITATRFVNEYQWGDLKGDPQARWWSGTSTRHLVPGELGDAAADVPAAARGAGCRRPLGSTATDRRRVRHRDRRVT